MPIEAETHAVLSEKVMPLLAECVCSRSGICIVACAGCSKNPKRITKKEFKKYCKENGYSLGGGDLEGHYMYRLTDGAGDPSSLEPVEYCGAYDDKNPSESSLTIAHYQYKDEDAASEKFDQIYEDYQSALKRELKSSKKDIDVDEVLKLQGNKFVLDLDLKGSKNAKASRQYLIVMLIEDTIVFSGTTYGKVTDKKVKEIDKIINDLCY